MLFLGADVPLAFSPTWYLVAVQQQYHVRGVLHGQKYYLTRFEPPDPRRRAGTKRGDHGETSLCLGAVVRLVYVHVYMVPGAPAQPASLCMG